ncbi:MAG: hypothetical protein RR834_07200 [Thermomonas sp.]
MTWPNEIALTPASLATDGEQGEGAKAFDPCEAEHNRSLRPLLLQAVAGLRQARCALNCYAVATDTPAHAAVEAADLVDAALTALDGAP